MQLPHGYLRKLTRLGLALMAVAMLTLPASASAVIDAQKATAAPKYRVLIVTAGSKKDAVNDAGVDAIKAIGKDTGSSGKFSVFVANNADQITPPRIFMSRNGPTWPPAAGNLISRR